MSLMHATKRDGDWNETKNHSVFEGFKYRCLYVLKKMYKELKLLKITKMCNDATKNIVNVHLGK